MITCPHCAGLNVAGCCLCQGSRRVEDDPRASVWIWNYAGCDCEACRVLAGQYRCVGEGSAPPERPALLEDLDQPRLVHCACGRQFLAWPKDLAKNPAPICSVCEVVAKRRAARQRNKERKERLTLCS